MDSDLGQIDLILYICTVNQFDVSELGVSHVNYEMQQRRSWSTKDKVLALLGVAVTGYIVLQATGWFASPVKKAPIVAIAAEDGVDDETIQIAKGLGHTVILVVHDQDRGSMTKQEALEKGLEAQQVYFVHCDTHQGVIIALRHISATRTFLSPPFAHARDQLEAVTSITLL